MLLLRQLFHDQIILDGFDPVDAPGDFTRFIHGLLRINKAAQLHGAPVSFDTDLKCLEEIICRKQGLYLGRDDCIVNILTGTFTGGC